MGWYDSRATCSLRVVAITPLLSFLDGPELFIVGAIILVLFGGAKLPQLARSLGSAQREFKKGVSGDDDGGSSNNTPNATTPAQTSESANTSDSDKA